MNNVWCKTENEKKNPLIRRLGRRPTVKIMQNSVAFLSLKETTFGVDDKFKRNWTECSDYMHWIEKYIDSRIWNVRRREQKGKIEQKTVTAIQSEYGKVMAKEVECLPILECTADIAHENISTKNRSFQIITFHWNPTFCWNPHTEHRVNNIFKSTFSFSKNETKYTYRKSVNTFN